MINPDKTDSNKHNLLQKLTVITVALAFNSGKPALSSATCIGSHSQDAFIACHLNFTVVWLNTNTWS